MQETGADASAIRRMIVHGNAQFRLQFDRPEPANLLDAQFSMQYALAVRAISGRGTLDQFQPQRTAEPEVRAPGRRHHAARRPHHQKAWRVSAPRDRTGRRAASSVTCCTPRAPGRTREPGRAGSQGRLSDRPGARASRRREIEAVVAGLQEQADARALTRLLVRGGQGAGQGKSA